MGYLAVLGAVVEHNGQRYKHVREGEKPCHGCVAKSSIYREGQPDCGTFDDCAVNGIWVKTDEPRNTYQKELDNK